MKSLNGKEIKPGVTIVYPVRQGSSMNTRLAKVTAAEMIQDCYRAGHQKAHVTAKVIHSSGYQGERMKGTVVHLNEIGRMIVLDDEPTEHLDFLAEVAKLLADWSREDVLAEFNPLVALEHQAGGRFCGELAQFIWGYLIRNGR